MRLNRRPLEAHGFKDHHTAATYRVASRQNIVSKEIAPLTYIDQRRRPRICLHPPGRERRSCRLPHHAHPNKIRTRLLHVQLLQDQSRTKQVCTVYLRANQIHSERANRHSQRRYWDPALPGPYSALIIRHDEITKIAEQVPGDFAFFYLGSKVEFLTKVSGLASYAITRPVKTPYPKSTDRIERMQGKSIEL